jgi:hypothetical protein
MVLVPFVRSPPSSTGKTFSRACPTGRRAHGWAVVATLLSICSVVNAAPHNFKFRSTPSGSKPAAARVKPKRPIALIIGGTGMLELASGGTPAVLSSAEIYLPGTALAAPANPMGTGRSHHAAVVLPNGEVLIVGGVNELFLPLMAGPTVPWILSSSEIFDPASGRFRKGPSMATARDSPSAVLLNNGKVLIVGGGTSSAELYDPKKNVFEPTGSMAVERYGQTATLLTNGNVLVAGGGSKQAEIYEVATGKFSLTGAMQQNRIYHTATLLLDGRVLIAGGSPYARSSATASTELYDPLRGTFVPGPTMQEPRAGHTATLLTNGQVLIAGGHDDNSAEIYDPVAQQFVRTGDMSTGRFGHSALRWPDGRVLIAGGWNRNYQPLATTENYDVKTGKFTPGGNMVQARADHTASLIWVQWPLHWKTSTAVSATPTPPSPPPTSPTPANAPPRSQSRPGFGRD